MSLKPIPNQGLQIAEPEFLPTKAYQSGGFYWDGEAQLVIRSTLGDFLPPLIQTWPAGKRTGLFQLPEGGREVLCQSHPASTRNPIPARQLQLLSRSLEDFKRKADSPETTPNNRYIIQQFKLPDFDRDPDLYRLSGGFWNRRLHVLWGCERAAESSLAPAAALAKLPSTRAFNISKKYLQGLTALLALVLLLLLLWWLWHSIHHDVPANKTIPIQAKTAPQSPAGAQGFGDQISLPGKSGDSGDNGSGGPGPGNGGNKPSATSPAGEGSPPGAAPVSSASRKSPNEDGANKPGVAEKPANDPTPKNQDSSTGGLELQKVGQQRLSDGTVAVQLAVHDRSNSGKTPKVARWEVDGTTKIGADKMSFDLTTGPHFIKVYGESPPGTPVVLSKRLTVTIHQELDIQLEAVK